MKYSHLYLHMGPGLNAYPERQLLAAKMPDTLFWDQPVVAEPINAFLKLAEASCAQAEKMAHENGGPIELIAHSFGGHLATEILRRRPELVKSCEFFSTGYDIPSGFLNLLRKLPAIATDEQRQAIKNFLENHPQRLGTKEKFWDYVNLIVPVADFMSLYWPTPEQYRKHVRIGSQGPTLDFPTFKNVLDDFIFNHMMHFPRLQWQGPIKIHFGIKDPLVLLDHETDLWKKIFPRAEFVTHTGSGHFTHLEKEIQ